MVVVDLKNIMVINMKKIVNNINTIKTETKKEMMVVLKSNAYNLGARIILKKLLSAGVTFFVFNHYEEYLDCQNLLNDAKVLILETVDIKQYDIPDNVRISVNSLKQVYELIKIKRKVTVHFQVDTGMNRDGIKSIRELKMALKLFQENPNITVEGIYTHFLGDKDDYYYYNLQQQRFLSYLCLYNFEIVHTAATSSLSKSIIGNYVRVGLGIYGYGSDLQLESAVKVYTKLLNVRNIKRGESVGYSATYFAGADELIGILPVGYYEGIKGGYVYCHKKRYEIIGKICMNHTFIKVDNAIKNSSLLNIFPRNDKIDNKKETNYYEVLTSYRNFSRIYITEYSNDIREIFKNTNKKGFKLKQRDRSN